MHVQANDILILGHKSAVSMAHVMCYRNRTSFDMERRDTIRYDTIEEFVDSKAEYSALCSTRSQKKKQTHVYACFVNSLSTGRLVGLVSMVILAFVCYRTTVPIYFISCSKKTIEEH